MQVEVAKSAGFCFGVNRAVTMVKDLLQKGRQVCTLGPIIHNPQTLAEMEQMGASVVDRPEQAPVGSTLVIRSHGVSRQVRERIAQLPVQCADATCPFVAKIHRIVAQQGREGRTVLVAGNPNHPEVQGILGYCTGPAYVFRSTKELQNLLESGQVPQETAVSAAAQTTFSVAEWRNCLKILNRVYTNIKIFDTICNATVSRQAEAEQLAHTCDAMIVLGGRQSSNTAKLYDVCKKYTKTFFAQSAADLPRGAFAGMHHVGITAGASTPASIIKEVLVTMAEINEGVNSSPETADGGDNFAEMLEESLKSLNTDEKVHGVVVGVTPTEVLVDVGRKQSGFIPRAELTSDPNAKIEDIVKVGDEMDLLIMRTNDQEGTIMLSKRRLDAAKGWDEIVAAEEDQTVLTGNVVEIVKGGVIAVTHGVRVFIPASQATASRSDPLDALLHQEVKFRIIEVNRNRRRAVGSIRSVLRDERKKLAEKFWETAEVGKEYDGVVKSLTSYGAFVDLGGIDGMIHISELSWTRIKHPSEVVNIGDKVHVYIKNLDHEKGKISLGYKLPEDNPWEVLKRDYPAGTVVEATIVGMTTFGAFARIIPGIDGLIHISQIADHRIEKPQDVLQMGQTVKAVITDIDFDRHRVSLSIRKLIESGELADTAEDSAE
ncbi:MULTISPECIES: bifunctional 4-hydroxy-3-methylbut-2-enyl diphosphate reductase/30S ribosomal protein S1 [Caproicibacterium]|uniref:4-hydroxy-3-methylbut-2-enyl diphosphate reductase n=1 Tax=Caproicibacterium lactatifermentans TaxID=2666138 RepID=A0A859DV14_9FIRM|nr:bifunctional 4-hydroxy-3-methylbut-2-enyl diphosphate reductase/30S ribosomal protein S1 [Caproicibacterium lactatifermentans]ARP50408.1 4-hydroxy-3-methylbut-2-enyl diphosphate reductase [Ruminococcaceae bacterium CPB6]QKN23871.1 bifunctional 4-hydroxy-3-methylbut-2-enyl diphosphate reductase/30S ribosomal protein S1 [Caproicibacterium lactatifermentans]QKO31059.1 bifunctional 4-hydroxy-3-methylbut-2-enyl diphosphate reductase/30S ribosomal protein S1 [Caproicibacterium lactatifermentans]